MQILYLSLLCSDLGEDWHSNWENLAKLVLTKEEIEDIRNSSTSDEERMKCAVQQILRKQCT